ncbi:EscE/YscE/SsaE family type III secretion system needle protein co-chaperone [Clostridium akagii]|uniref:EscE/YscE/SsaE family type III secretion system needle protein co-chaperone n=1 Tax=Clostridium akagii TaxID=91623 RepID=UPI00047C597D|nr:EscE/YscE/SsaE family type III secretion system needle protein co-chaperone [Clostridium akagii]
METKNAKQHVQDVTTKLQDAKNCLNQALSSVEKPENKQQIANTLDSVDIALQDANATLSNYKE